MCLNFKDLFLGDTPLLDVRSPCEFERGAFPGVVNIPLLDDEQRHKVGKRYKEHGRQKAIELGLRLINNEDRMARVEAWKQFAVQNPTGYLYCFRGGLRSRFTQDWLQEAGVSYPMIPGGYKSMRTFLIEQLDYYSSTLPFVLLGGRTGSGKTAILNRLPSHIDLEGLARHRGSSFGGLLTPQPANIDFDNSLAIAMLKKDSMNDPRVFLEDEGRLIGRISLPLTLRERMLRLPIVLLVEPLEHRVQVAEKDYIADLLTLYRNRYGNNDGVNFFADHHRNALQRIRKRFGGAKVDQTTILFENGLSVHMKTGTTESFHPYITALLTQYYDPMYDYQLKNKQRTVLFSGSADEVIAWSNEL